MTIKQYLDDIQLWLSDVKDLDTDKLNPEQESELAFALSKVHTNAYDVYEIVCEIED